MKVILMILTLITSFNGFTKGKVYTQEDFDKKLKEAIKKKVKILKTKSLTQLTNEILEKEYKLQSTEKELITREEQVKISENTLLKKIEELELQKSKIIGCIDDNKRTEQMRIKQLVSVISNMKPQKAADLLSVQDSAISIKIIEQIDPAKASKIFNLMEKEVSARLQKQYLNMQK